MNSSDKNVLVLGGSSWLGYLLVNKLVIQGIEVSGTIHKSSMVFPDKVKIYRAAHLQKDYQEIIEKTKPNVIVNFLRGEDDEGLSIHKTILKKTEENIIHYIYASSALALDGYNYLELTELLKAKSSSPYGIFKGKCEEEMYDSNGIWTILRFASVQGWVPHKKTRNQFFLEKLASENEITVDRGVMQNRILASLLIEGIIDIIKDKVTGIIHFGSQDASEEYEFLRKQAAIFGYDPSLVKPGKQRNVNLVTIPNKLFKLYGDKYLVSQEDTLKGLLQIEELKKIQSKGSTYGS